MTDHAGPLPHHWSLEARRPHRCHNWLYNPEPLSQSNACSENPSSLRQKLCFPLLPHTASNSPRLSANTWHIRDCALRGVFAGIALHKREMRPKKTRAVSLGSLGTLGTLGRLKQSRRDSQRTAVDSKHNGHVKPLTMMSKVKIYTSIPNSLQ
jgi:hypothetical protein